MQNIDQPLQSGSNQDWQILGELELTVGPASDHVVRKWFPVILGLLAVHVDFATRVLRSAQETVSRTINTESVVKSEHIHLIIMIPEYWALNNQNWGFFRIEKIGNDETVSGHTIEFFLYQEG